MASVFDAIEASRYRTGGRGRIDRFVRHANELSAIAANLPGIQQRIDGLPYRVLPCFQATAFATKRVFDLVG